MSDEAYRAVFLRVHPTGKMVLGLTTESDGRETDYAKLVAGELGVPPLDVKVVPPTPTASGSATASTRSRRTARRRRSATPPRRSATRRSCWPGWRPRPRRSRSPGQWRLGGRRHVQDDRGHRAVRARVRPAAARRRGRARRPDRLPGLRQAGVDLHAHLVRDLQRPNSAVYGFMPHSVCLTTAAPVTRPSTSVRSNAAAASRRAASGHRRPRAHCRRAAPRSSGCGDVVPAQHLVVDRRLDVREVVIVERLDAAGALAHAQRCRRRRGPGLARRRCRASRSTPVTWIRRSWPALAIAPVRDVRTARIPSSGGMCRSARRQTIPGRSPWQSSSNTRSR